MLAMKDRFTAIVTELDSNYQTIELETAAQFTSYVAQLKQEMNSKVAALSQVDEARRHRCYHSWFLFCV